MQKLWTYPENYTQRRNYRALLDNPVTIAKLKKMQEAGLLNTEEFEQYQHFMISMMFN